MYTHTYFTLSRRRQCVWPRGAESLRLGCMHLAVEGWAGSFGLNQ